MEKPHKKLEAWKAAIDTVLFVYKLADGYSTQRAIQPEHPSSPCCNQHPCNIAEGAARQSKKEFVKFLYIAKGSLSELDTQFELARLLGYLSSSEWDAMNHKLTHVDRLLSGLLRHLRTGK